MFQGLFSIRKKSGFDILKEIEGAKQGIRCGYSVHP